MKKFEVKFTAGYQYRNWRWLDHKDPEWGTDPFIHDWVEKEKKFNSLAEAVGFIWMSAYRGSQAYDLFDLEPETPEFDFYKDYIEVAVNDYNCYWQIKEISE